MFDEAHKTKNFNSIKEENSTKVAQAVIKIQVLCCGPLRGCGYYHISIGPLPLSPLHVVHKQCTLTTSIHISTARDGEAIGRDKRNFDFDEHRQESEKRCCFVM